MAEPTNKQIGFAKKLGIKNPEQYTKEQLSELIDKAKAEMKNKVVQTVRESVEASSVSVTTSTTNYPEEVDIKHVLQQYLRSYSKMLILYDEVYLLSNLQAQTNSELSSELIVNRITDIFKQIEQEVSNMIEYKLKLLDYKLKSNVESLLSFFEEEINSKIFQSFDPKALSNEEVEETDSSDVS